jgi:hypothetical protein
MLGLVAFCWAIWNRVCFEKKPLKDLSDIMFSVCVFIRYWTELYPEEEQAMINAGVGGVDDEDGVADSSEATSRSKEDWEWAITVLGGR